ncbi:hypothetical protein [Glaesserella sp.]|uniref:hypothetical protein n=1 Tax=Glaesserella sp. TaxID=2094731 RepID=UPI00359FB63D
MNLNSLQNNLFYSDRLESSLKTFIRSENKTTYVRESFSSDITYDINLFTSSDVPIEFLSNENFKNELISKFQSKFINFMMFEEVVEDYYNSIELELLNYFDRNSYVTGQWFSKLFTDFINKPRMLVNLLKILAKLKHDTLPNTHICIAALLSNKDMEVKDFAIRVFESWGDSKSLKILENTAEISPKWLEDYKQSVIEDLKEKC